MNLLYKFTDANWETKNRTKWGPGVTHTAPGAGALCTEGWLHAYLSPELATLLNPIHAAFKDPVLWEAEGEIGARDGQLKVGSAALTTVRTVEVPVFTMEQRVKFAILCAKAVYHDPDFVAWADAWLGGADRSYKAEAAAAWAEAAAWAAAEAVAAAAAEEVAAWAARSAAWATAATASFDLVAIAKQALEP